MSSATSSSLSSLRIEGPPLARRKTGTSVSAGTVERRMPRVQKSASTFGRSGTMSMSTRSRPVVGPWK